MFSPDNEGPAPQDLNAPDQTPDSEASSEPPEASNEVQEDTSGVQPLAESEQRAYEDELITTPNGVMRRSEWTELQRGRRDHAA